MRKVVVVGTTGSGKTTVARELAARLGVPHLELDAQYWGPNWSEPPKEEFRARVAEALVGDAWVVDGNYSKVRDIVWGRADTLVWLDYPLMVILRQLIVRTVRRTVSGEQLWSGNRERFVSIFSCDSIILWALKTYRRRLREYVELPRSPEYAHLSVVRLRSVRETRWWLDHAAPIEAQSPLLSLRGTGSGSHPVIARPEGPKQSP